MFHFDQHDHAPGDRPGLFRVLSRRLHFTLSHFWRLFMATLLASLFSIGLWGGLITPVYAASLARQALSHHQSTLALTVPQAQHLPRVKQALALPQAPVQQGAAKLVNSQTPLDGLGDLPFFTYLTYSIDDHLKLKVNVANGNLVAHLSNLHIQGTGIDESVEGYYNSQASLTKSDLGNNWNFNQGRDVYLDLSNPTQGIIFHGPSGYSAYFAYNSSNQTYTDVNGLNATLVFNSGANTYTLTFHRTGEKLAFGSNGNETSDKEKNGNALSYSYNGTNDLLSLTDSQGRVTTFSHNTAYGSSSSPSGQITGLTDPASRTVKYTYSERSNPVNSFTTLTDAMGKITTFDYTGKDLTSITDPLGNMTTISYDSGDKVNTITDATKQGTIIFAYNSTNTVVTDRNGHNTTYSYDTNTSHPYMISSVMDALGHSKSTQYDANFDVNTYGDALSDTTTSTYSQDGKNNLNSVQDGNGAATSYTYPASGSSNLFYPLTQKDPQGNQTNFAYDTNGNLLSSLDNSNSMGLHSTYNANGTVSKITQDVNSTTQNVTTFGYDAHGNLINVTPPTTNGSTLKPSTLTVDANTSRVNSVIDGNNNQTTYTYDNFDRVTTISYAGGASIAYTFDSNGNLLTVQDNTGLTTFTYDALNRLRTKTLPGGTIITTAYDQTGNLTSLNDGGGAVTYTYDQANRMTALTEPDAAKTTYSYDNADRKIMIQYPNLTGMKMTYDKAGHELTNIGGTMDSNGTILTTYDSFTYSYTSGTTPRSLVQSVQELDPVSRSTTYNIAYAYDSQNRLTDAKRQQGGTSLDEWTYAYDTAGNRTSDKLTAPKRTVTDTYTYAGGNELQSVQTTCACFPVSTVSTTTYAYDGNGNLSSVGFKSTVTPFTYNTKNQTTSIGSDSYTYSGGDQTDRVQVNADTFVYTGLGLSARTDSSGTTHFVRCSCGLLNDERTPDGKKYYYLFDGLGSIVGLTNSSGTEVNSYDYDPYGQVSNLTEQSGLNNPWKFAGGYLDSNASLGSNLYKFGTRYYDPSIGRWTQLDSAGTGYVYANDNPVNEVDPSGKYTFAQWWFVLGSCLASSVIAPFLALATLLGVGAAVWAAIAAIASATAPAWLPWVVLVGGALVFAVVLGCAAFATLNTWRFFE